MPDPLLKSLEEILAHAERYVDDCARGILRRDEVQQQVQYVDATLRDLFQQDSPLRRIADRRWKEHTDFWRRNVSGYAEDFDCENLRYRIETIRRLLAELEPEFLRATDDPKNQYYFGVGETYRAKRRLFEILRGSQKHLDIIDEYLDADVFDYVESLDGCVRVRMLTGKKKPVFTQLLHAIQEVRANVEARQNTSCHDRFIVLDDSAVWHAGASLNGFGKAAFMIHRVTDDTERRRVIDDFALWWSSGQRL